MVFGDFAVGAESGYLARVEPGGSPRGEVDQPDIGGRYGVHGQTTLGDGTTLRLRMDWKWLDREINVRNLEDPTRPYYNRNRSDFYGATVLVSPPSLQGSSPKKRLSASGFVGGGFDYIRGRNWGDHPGHQRVPMFHSQMVTLQAIFELSYRAYQNFHLTASGGIFFGMAVAAQDHSSVPELHDVPYHRGQPEALFHTDIGAAYFF